MPETKWPTHCEHDILFVCGVKCEEISKEDEARLAHLGFYPNEDDETSYISTRFGSC